MKLKCVLIALAAAVASASFGLRPAEEMKIESSAFGESIPVNVMYPSRCLADSTYKAPVVYVLNGNRFGEAVAGMAAATDDCDFDFVHEPIVVSVPTIDSLHDYSVHAMPVADCGADSLLTAVGADRFMQFLDKELLPAIAELPQAGGKSYIVGHDDAALFVIYEMIHNPRLYSGYVCVAPDGAEAVAMMGRAKADGLKRIDFGGATLYIATPGKISEKSDEHIDDSAHTIMTELFSMASRLNMKSRHYVEDTKSSMAIPAIYDGLRQVGK